MSSGTRTKHNGCTVLSAAAEFVVPMHIGSIFMDSEWIDSSADELNVCCWCYYFACIDGSFWDEYNRWVLNCLLSVCCYRNTLLISMSLGDRVLEAQACYSLGNTYTLLRQYERSVEYHMRHLHIARELRDRVGEARACWSLGNAYSALQRTDLALHYTTLHLDISRQVLFVFCKLYIC